MTIDIEMLKQKYRKRTRADIVDINSLQMMVPVLVREICRLEESLKESEEYVRFLEKRRPPADKEGSSGSAVWSVSYDSRKNRLRIKLSGVFDYKASKKASNAVMAVMENVQKEFDVINDIKEVKSISDIRTVFQLRKINFMMSQAGVNRIVRVVDTSNNLIVALFKKNTIKGAAVFLAETVEEAEEILEKEGQYLKQ